MILTHTSKLMLRSEELKAVDVSKPSVEFITNSQGELVGDIHLPADGAMTFEVLHMVAATFAQSVNRPTLEILGDLYRYEHSISKHQRTNPD